MSIFNHFKHLNLSQRHESALTKLEQFFASPTQMLIMEGYAGSSKTTILKGLVEYLILIEKDFALMGPTGRVDKVIREKIGKEAFTIHKSIYSYEDMVEIEEGDSYFYYYKIRNNVDVAGEILIVNEASMLSHAKSEDEIFRLGSSYFLPDLISYKSVAQPNVNSKINFDGDPCLLPPEGDIISNKRKYF